ncbi:MAG: PAS domain S-box protein [Acidobacteria bacterium]|nr:PAS domain S-box protein [Acidobacteriota bacterium]
MINPGDDALFGSELWQAALEKYASSTHLTVRLFDAGERPVLGPVHLTPIFQLFEDTGYDPGLFLECARKCLAQTGERPAVVVSQFHGLAVVGTSLLLEGKIVGAAVGGYALADFSQVSEIQRLARQAGLGFERLWDVARQQPPVPQRRLMVHGELLQVLGDALLRENYRTRQYEQAAAIVESSEDAIISEDLNGVITSWNRGAEQLFGYTALETLGQQLAMLLPHDRPEEEPRILELIRGGESIENYEVVRRRKDGRLLDISLTASPITAARGQLAGASEIGRDITDRKRAEEALRESEERYRALYDALPVAAFVCDRNAVIQNYNRRAVELWGREPEVGVERHWGSMKLILPDGSVLPQGQSPMMEVLRSGIPARNVDVFIERPDGSRVPVIVNFVALKDEEGAIVGVVTSFDDVTDRKQAEEALRSADRMEAVGRLAGGVAHEANNQMTVVLGCASFALGRPDLPPELREELLNVQKAAERTAAITAQLLAFSRRQLLQPVPLDLNEVVSGFAPILRRTLGVACELALELSPGEDAVLADRGQLEQVLLNLTLNARDAMPDGGTLAIETGFATLGRPEPGSSSAEPSPPGRYGVLTVRDTGNGMSPETLARIFEPFFTTKHLGEGTGLGLSTVYGIVRQLGGEIRVRSEPGTGTTFRIYLPLAESPAAAEADRPTEPLVAGTGTVLVVEDEPVVRSLMVRALEVDGFQVLEAGHGQAALELLGSHRGAVDAVVVDVAMPIMGGRELAERLARSHPEIPVLLMSGYAADELVQQGLLPHDGVPLLPKPFLPEVLVQRVRALVGSVPSRAG